MPVGLITGASRGLGRAVAALLAADDWDLIVDARDEASLVAAATSWPSKVTALSGDVADPEHRSELIREVEAAGRLDLLLNNASTLGPTPLPELAELEVAAFARLFDVNTVAPLALVQACLPMLTESRGVIINVSSDAATEAYAGWGGYGASKAALDQVTAVLGAEHEKLSIYAFDPGDMRTAMARAAFPGQDLSDRSQPEDVAPAVLGLISRRPPSGRYTVADLSASAAR